MPWAIYLDTALPKLPVAGVAKSLDSSSQLSSFAGGETCNRRCQDHTPTILFQNSNIRWHEPSCFVYCLSAITLALEIAMNSSGIFHWIWITIEISFTDDEVLTGSSPKASGLSIPLCVKFRSDYTELTHWGRDKMDAISQTIFSNGILEWKCMNFDKHFIFFHFKFVPKGPINNIPAMVQIMAWRRLGDKPLSEAMMVNLLTHICVTRSQWVKRRSFSNYSWV